MTSEQKNKVSLLAKNLSVLSEELNASNLFVTTREDPDGTLILSANEEGLVYIASIMLSLATQASKGQHYHFDHTTVLSECQRPIIIQFESTPTQPK